METTAWHEHSNDKQRGVDWQFKVDDARMKLKSVYPKIKCDRALAVVPEGGTRASSI